MVFLLYKGLNSSILNGMFVNKEKESSVNITFS